MAHGFSLDNLGTVYAALGDLDRAEAMHRRALEIFRRRGPFDGHVATALGNLSNVYRQRGEWERAEAYRLRACDAHERVWGVAHPETFLDWAQLAEIYRSRGDRERADRMIRLLLSAGAGAPAPTQRFLAEMLHTLAGAALHDFQLDLAERLGVRAAELLAALEGPNAPETLAAMYQLGRIQHATGDLESARASVQRSLDGFEALGRRPEAADALVELGKIHRDWENHDLARELFAAAVQRLRAGSPPDPQRLASALGNLADVHLQRDEIDEADRLYSEALGLLDPSEPDGERPWLLHNVGILHYHAGRLDAAKSACGEARRLWTATLGPDHPFVATAAANLALVHWSAGDAPAAAACLAEAGAIRDREMRRVLAVGSERKRAAYARDLQSDLHKVVSLVFASRGAAPDLMRYAAELLLQRKGRVLDAAAYTFAHVHDRVDEQDRRLLDRLQAVRAEIAGLVAPTLVSRGPLSQPERLSALRRDEARLEAELSYRTALTEPALEAVSLDDVQRAMPRDAVLVDLLKYARFDPVRTGVGRPWRESRYAAMVLAAAGAPAWFDLGPADAIDAAGDRLRSALRRRSSPVAEIELEAAAVYRLVVEPFAAAASRAARLLVSPDGKLTLVPFGVLRDAEGLTVSSRWTLGFLSAGRDVARAAAAGLPSRGVVVVTAPDFEAPPPAPSHTGPERFVDRGAFAPLPGTREEGADLAALLDDVTLITGSAATVDAVKAVRRPAVLHVATHGVFTPRRETELHWTTDLLRLGDRMVFLNQSAPVLENPMFFSGLALSGANQRGSTGGILTAQELAALDLRGTQLVVLSACETGLGTIKDGEEFAGLRRALAIAGAATQVTSLWRVDDEATRGLMARYYRRLLEGLGRADALAAAQRDLAEDAQHPEWQHPFYWAGFVSSGAWSPMREWLVRREEDEDA
jgi:CHAT domain-containing protein/tetratricopeptide (TPR) repeat protein